MTADPLVLWLDSDSLLSKYGFNDGDMPDNVMDYCDEHAIDWYSVNWHDVLSRLVRKHLLPKLEKHHAIELIDIETIHNPIRALSVDGVTAFGRPPYPITLRPRGVKIPMKTVVAAFTA